jgi:general secretion pathway protein L
MLVDDEGVGASFDSGPGLPLALRVALDEAAARGDKPTSVRVHTEGGATLPDLARFSAETGVPFTPGTQWDALSNGQPATGTIDLLQGELAPRRTSVATRIPRAAAITAVLIIVLQGLFIGADALRMSRERDRLEAQREAIFRGAFPEAKAVVDPELQMSRNLEELRRARGLAEGDDFLAQLTRVARESKAVSSVQYESGRLVAR